MAAGTAQVLDFERPILELEKRIESLRAAGQGRADVLAQIQKLEQKARRLEQEIFNDLTRWQIVQLSRHSSRPGFLEYVSAISEDYVELSGDRAFAEDRSLVGGFARFDGRPVLMLGHQKGKGTKENMVRNFGMPRPEGYRKARRLMGLAARFNRPIVAFIDTPGAYPGIGAEERGQAEAIASNLEYMAQLPVPVVAVVIGEGGSGGALAIGVANRVLMLQNAIYSVISPEACSSILYRDANKASKAAEALKLTARDLLGLGVIDEIVPEPVGGAHRDRTAAAASLAKALRKQLMGLLAMSGPELISARYQKFRAMGQFREL